ncbi:hypothetical protein [Pantoea vagans]|uniref:hypothetical protein n=1 Tax=Pantoea vagans TaxID=470934 RepID=UPI003B011CDE
MILAALQRQVKLINRASTVQPCQYIGGATTGATLIQDSLLFKFGGSDYQALLPESRKRLSEILNVVNKAGKINTIRITGFTDGIGNSDINTRPFTGSCRYRASGVSARWHCQPSDHC